MKYDYNKLLNYESFELDPSEKGINFIRRYKNGYSSGLFTSFEKLISHIALRWGLIERGEYLKLKVCKYDDDL